MTNQNALAATPDVSTESRGRQEGSHLKAPTMRSGDVVELYPGASGQKNRKRRLTASEAGMATAEYAIATLAAVGFAGILVFILRSDEVRGFLLTLIRTALALP